MGYEGGNWDLTAAFGSGGLCSPPAQGTSCQPAQPAQDSHTPASISWAPESRVPDPLTPARRWGTEAEGVTHSRGDTQASRFSLSTTSQRKILLPLEGTMESSRNATKEQDWDTVAAPAVGLALVGSLRQPTAESTAHRGSRQWALPRRLSQP